MPAQLVALNDGPNILVDKPILLLGRHPECDIQIDSRKISRRHCCIAQVNDYLVVRDLDSTNGIRINGIRVIEGKLHSGDELTVGSHRYRVDWDQAGPAPRAAVRAVPTPPSPSPVVRAPLPMDIDEDDMLEECDEPVALPDPRPVAPPLMPPPTNDRTARGPTNADSLVIPEDLELMPGSGSFPGPADLPGPHRR